MENISAYNQTLFNKGARDSFLEKPCQNKGFKGAEAPLAESLANKGFKGVETPSAIEPFFDGIRKDNARLIFGILLTFIIVDFGYELMV